MKLQMEREATAGFCRQLEW